MKLAHHWWIYMLPRLTQQAYCSYLNLETDGQVKIMPMPFLLNTVMNEFIVNTFAHVTVVLSVMWIEAIPAY